VERRHSAAGAEVAKMPKNGVARELSHGLQDLHVSARGLYTRPASCLMQTIRTKFLILVVGSALIGVTLSSSAGLAQDQALKNCREQWRASQAALRASGIDQKAFIAECRAGAAARAGAASASPGSPDSQTNPASATPAPVAAGETLRIKACLEEWRTKRRTKRGTDELRGLTEKAYMEQCRSGSTSAPPSSGAPSPR
jgi:hypothetical protein